MYHQLFISQNRKNHVNCPKVSNCTHLKKKKYKKNKTLQQQNSCFFHDRRQYYFIDFYLAFYEIRYINEVNILGFPKWKSIWRKWGCFLVGCDQLHWVEKFKICCLPYFISTAGEKSLLRFFSFIFTGK